MRTEEFQARVAQVALAVAREHGFALAGGHALIAHGIVSRPTEDVDLFTDESDASTGLDDSVFDLYEQTPQQIAEIRARFSDWPRHTTRESGSRPTSA